MKSKILLFAVIFFGACNMPETVKPQFTTPDGYVTRQLKDLNSYEDVKVRWGAIGLGDSVVNYLKLELKNGKNLPSEDDSLKIIGKNALYILLNSISNEPDYSKFTVVFIKKIKKGMIREEEIVPFEYKLEEFKETDTNSN